MPAGRPKGSKSKVKHDSLEKFLWVVNKLGGARRLLKMAQESPVIELEVFKVYCRIAEKQAANVIKLDTDDGPPLITLRWESGNDNNNPVSTT